MREDTSEHAQFGSYIILQGAGDMVGSRLVCNDHVHVVKERVHIMTSLRSELGMRIIMFFLNS
jgi:hypothetical protein